jgi:NAD(P)-dependent dehydrogenase (short-subunit alcohol dehydrogenase family)
MTAERTHRGDGVATLQGSTAVVTGAGSGIGRAVTHELARRGAAIVAVDIKPEVRDVVAECGGRDRARAVRGDVRKAGTVARAFAAAEALGHPLGALVTCAFAAERAPLTSVTPAGWQQTLDVTLTAAVRFATAFADRAGPGAAIVTVGSVYSAASANTFGPYAAAKAALLSVTRTLAIELAPRGIRCNAVLPGFVAVDRNADVWQDDEALARLMRAYPMARPGTPAEVARCVAFLASAEASFVTGAALPVDGGLLAQLPEGVTR